MAVSKLQRVTTQPGNPYSHLIPNQQIAIVPSFTLESGVTLTNVPVAYSTRGRLSPSGDNAMVICHALSGSSDVSDWWGPLMGKGGKAFDVTRFFIICINSLGSPYGTASPVTFVDGDPEKGTYGPEFPLTTIRDDVRLAKILLDDLGVTRIAAVIGGSMGGMLVLEYAFLGEEYVRCIVPMATSARHSAWCISWGEAQRQNIFSDPKYEDGYYPSDDPPKTGLGAARMAALLTYRSRDSFESRFGRNVPDPKAHPGKIASRPSTPAGDHFAIHNEGHERVGHARSPSSATPTPASPSTAPANSSTNADANGALTLHILDPEMSGAVTTPTIVPQPRRKGAGAGTPSFSAQSYLRYQAQKFITRFDANCYIAITRKLDTHDVSLHTPDTALHGSSDGVRAALALVRQPALVLGIESDGLFTFAEQRELAEYMPRATLGRIESMEGHDAFLLQFEQVNAYILEFLGREIPDLMARSPVEEEGGQEGEVVTKESVFGEAEVGDITAW